MLDRNLPSDHVARAQCQLCSMMTCFMTWFCSHDAPRARSSVTALNRHRRSGLLRQTVPGGHSTKGFEIPSAWRKAKDDSPRNCLSFRCIIKCFFLALLPAYILSKAGLSGGLQDMGTVFADGGKIRGVPRLAESAFCCHAADPCWNISWRSRVNKSWLQQYLCLRLIQAST